MKRARDNGWAWTGDSYSCLEFKIGNFRMWISASCVFEEAGDGRYTKEKDALVELHAPPLTGLVGEHSPFGRYIEEKKYEVSGF